MFNKMRIELAKLSLLIRYGGIWINRHYFALESFDWITNIANYPSKFVYNRYGNLPKVLMFYHPHFGQPFEWTYDQDYNTKNMWHIALDSNFIAAEPQAQLLKDWIRIFTQFIRQSYQESYSKMVSLNIAT